MSTRRLRNIRLARKIPACRHEGFHSATSHYDRRAAELRFLLVCDACGAQLQEVTCIRYRPRFDLYRGHSLAA
jgi:hypothetical protein